MLKRLLVSSLAVLSLQLAGCGGGMEEGEVQTPPTPVTDDKTQAGPINGLRYGTHVTYYSDSTRTTVVGMREWGCSSATSLINWGEESGYESTWKFICAQEPQE
ncbi:hypothetical protein [Corallococcus aberystwythensis]|uniref:Uncharacterized protein n=1 Tax=Corallococcus aberystwythensis TaxID=2316722 RepID=A0A3A8R2E8_9BACT|nr:hypothetical protein [Corallococcus aberystwythensis]RKH72945.1 hypothetical protein D7W81_04980 [Corallococcus aberystwythensis]